MIQVFDEMTAPSINGTSLKGYIEGWSYDDMVHVLGEPTFNEPSGDDKTQVEWVCKFNDQVFTIYDWKTYDREFTLNELTTWNVGGMENASGFIQAVERNLARTLVEKLEHSLEKAVKK